MLVLNIKVDPAKKHFRLVKVAVSYRVNCLEQTALHGVSVRERVSVREGVRVRVNVIDTNVQTTQRRG